MSRTRKSVTVSYAGLGAIVAVLVIGGTTWKAVGSIATKADITSIQMALSPRLDRHEDWIRQLQLDWAARFGASPVSTRPNSTGDIFGAFPVLAQFAAQKQETSPQRAVVPIELIDLYKLQPTRGGSYNLLGEDGRYYSLDDVLFVIIRLHLNERRK